MGKVVTVTSLWARVKSNLPVIGIIVTLISISWTMSMNADKFPNFLLAVVMSLLLVIVIFGTAIFVSNHYEQRTLLDKITTEFRERSIRSQQFADNICESHFNNLLILQKTLSLNSELQETQALLRGHLLNHPLPEGFEDKIFSVYNVVAVDNGGRFFRNVLIHTQEFIEGYLKSKGICLDVALSIEKLSQPFNIGKDNPINYTVNTLFRDHRTYSKNIRDYHQPLTVTGNTHFSHLITGDNLREAVFIKNDLEDSKSRAQYRNEVPNFLKYYDAIISVPIADFTQKNNSVVYGFLVCDTRKGDEYPGEEIYDENVGKLLLSSSLVLALYFNAK